MISVVVLQNPMDLQQCDIGSSRNETTITDAEIVSHEIEEVDQQAMTIQEMKTEPEVSAVPVVSICTFIIGLIRIACLYIWVFL